MMTTVVVFGGAGFLGTRTPPDRRGDDCTCRCAASRPGAESLERAAQGTYGVYSVQDFWAMGAKREVMQGRNLADAAKKAGVQHFVFSSVGGADRHSGIDHWGEQMGDRKVHPPNRTPGNHAAPCCLHGKLLQQVEIGILKGKLMDAVRADKPYQTIATDDIGGFEALAFEQPQDFIGLELELAGSELTNLEAAEIFSRVLDKPVKFRKLPLPIVRLFLGKEFYQMFRWFNEAGFKTDIAELPRRPSADARGVAAE